MTGREEQVLAQLGLQATPGQSSRLVGAMPSDEELAAFLEGKLDTARRAQITGYLANDTACYQRWLRCIEANVALGDVGSTASRTEPVRAGFLERLKEILFGHRAVPAFAGSFAVIVLAVVILLETGQDYDMAVDRLYADFGPGLKLQWANTDDINRLKEFSSNRSFSLLPKTKSETRQVLESGYRSGAKSLGSDKFKQLNINIDHFAQLDKANVMKNRETQALYELGRSLALSTMQCKLTPGSAGLANTRKVMAGLMSELQGSGAEEITKLRIRFSGKSDTDAVCNMTRGALALLLD